ncbi:protoporphyrinogen oxidase [Nocardioides pacificus]
MSTTRQVVVVGGGLAGLCAARALAAAGHEVRVLEGASEVGGKIRRTAVGGVVVDVGAEAMLNRRPEAVDLARELGLPIEHPTGASSQVWTHGALRPMPRSLMGVPLDLPQLEASGVMSEAGIARVREEPTVPPTVLADDEDVSVGSLVGSRFGEEVVDQLVEPLLGGVYAGDARALSARATVPMLVAMLRRGSLLEAAAAMPAPSGTPVFAGLRGGMGQLTETLAASGDFAVEVDAPVRELRRTDAGFELVVGPTTAPRTIAASDVVLATPAAPTARLLGDLAPAAAAELAAIDYASMAVVTFAFRAADLPELPGSGFLVPPADGRRIKASTFSGNKWDWVREAGRGAGPAGEDLVMLRTSIGRHREEASLQVPDEELVRVSLEDLAEAAGIRATPFATHVQRWGGGLPQYAVGHLDRVARIRADIAREVGPHLVVCGAAYDGVGIAAVVDSAQRAAAALG